MNDNSLSALDRALQTGGACRLKSAFAALAAADRQKALRLLDDEKLRFPAFFTVLPEIRKHNLTGALSPRNAAACAVCARKLGLQGSADDDAAPAEGETLYIALRWMIDTGKDWEPDGADKNRYEALIDYVSALLVATFEDASVLPDIARLIFRRRRQGRLIHDLVWCFYQTINYDALVYTADQLLSQDPGDAALAGKLLCLEALREAGGAELRELHDRYLEWLKENRPYLYVTDESFQQSNRPEPLSVDNEAKYLGKEISPRHRRPIEPLSSHEIACLQEYRSFSPEERELLADYSHKLRRSDLRAWEAWMQMQVAEQVIVAKGGYEAV